MHKNKGLWEKEREYDMIEIREGMEIDEKNSIKKRFFDGNS